MQRVCHAPEHPWHEPWLLVRPMPRKKPTNISEMLDAIEEAASDKTTITFDDVLDAAGRRSFGPFVLVAGLTILMPVIGDIPGVPSAVAVMLLLVAGQQVAGREQVWFPAWVRNRKAKSTKVRRGIRKLRRPARFVDRLVKPRLTWLTHGRGQRVAAVLTLVLALCIPMMDFVPFSANLAGATLLLLGLGLIAHDGLLMLGGALAALASVAVVVGAVWRM